MSSFRTLCALLVSLAMTAPAATFAATKGASSAVAAAQGSLMPDITMQPSRFSGPGIYTGKPALGVTLSMIMAGGGPSHFDSVTLLKTLTGAKFDAEVGTLTKQYGKPKVDNFLKVYNFLVSDTLQIVTAKHVALPSKPSPDPSDGRALSAALWGAGQIGRGFNVEVMLDRARTRFICKSWTTSARNSASLRTRTTTQS